MRPRFKFAPSGVSWNIPLESISAEVNPQQQLRINTERLGPLVPRRFKRHPRPRTAIISQAVNAKAVVSESLRVAAIPRKKVESCE